MSLIDGCKQFIKEHCPVWSYWALRRLQRLLVPRLRREDQEEHLFMSKFLKPGDLCFDVGCHLGRKARAMRNCGARVIGIEPEPVAQQMLELEFRNDPEFILVCVALADRSGKMTLHRNKNLSMTSFRDKWGDVVEDIQVEVTTLDELIHRFGLPVYCKVDVEGFEDRVFSGLSRPLPLLSFEIHQHEIDRAVQCLERFQHLGFSSTNMTPMDSATFSFKEFIPIEAMIDELQNKWRWGRRCDLYVRSNLADLTIGN